MQSVRSWCSFYLVYFVGMCYILRIITNASCLGYTLCCSCYILPHMTTPSFRLFVLKYGRHAMVHRLGYIKFCIPSERYPDSWGICTSTEYMVMCAQPHPATTSRTVRPFLQGTAVGIPMLRAHRNWNNKWTHKVGNLVVPCESLSHRTLPQEVVTAPSVHASRCGN